MTIAAAAIEDNDTGLGVLHDLVGYHLRRASNAFSSDFAVAIEGTGMRQVLFAILSVVSVNPGINQGAAARALGIQRANMVLLINQLVDAGLLDRQTAREDRRAFALMLTPAGTDALRDCTQRIEAHEKRMLADFSTAERKTLIALLTRIEARER